MLRDFRALHGLWLITAISLFLNLGCSEDTVGGGIDDTFCDAACELEKLQKLCGNGILDAEAGEGCDVVDGSATFKDGQDCTDYMAGGIGELKCTANCQIDSSDCRPKDGDPNDPDPNDPDPNDPDPNDPDPNDPDRKCEMGDSYCDVAEVDGKLTNVLYYCHDERFEMMVCDGSCDGYSCTPCRDNDLICNPEICIAEDEIPCFGNCCNVKDAFCDYEGVEDCCAFEDVCGQHCCDTGTVCENAVCRKACEFNRCVDVDNVEFCCDDGETCISNQCFRPSVSCIDNYGCENEEYCDPLLKQCLPQPKTEPACQRTPKGGEIVPTLLWHWGNEEDEEEVDCPKNVRVMSTPMVADLDGDGYPEVIFNAYSGSDHTSGVIRVVDGRTGKTKFTIKGEEGKPNECNLTAGGAQISIGDLNGDGLPDIVTCASVDRESGERSYDLIAFNHEGEFMWQSGRELNGETVERYCGQSGPGIVDFDGDGTPEVYVSYTVVNGQTGEIKWQQPCETSSESSGSHYYHNACEYSVAVDLDGDGRPELVGGNVAWNADGTLFYKADIADGYPAVADVTLDGKPDIAVVDFRNHLLHLLDNEGNVKWSSDINEGIEAPSATGGGPPNIANINADPYPEITLAGADAYMAYNHEGKRLWYKRTQDYSSKKTGASVFDFDGDGIAEAVYADEEWLRIYDGETGATRFCIPNTSATHWEYPVIADVTADGSAEIVVCSNNYSRKKTNNKLPINNGRDECVSAIIGPDPENPLLAHDDPLLAGTTGVRVFAAPNKDWVPTRKIWNQHAYSITNVHDDGTIPKTVRPNWSVNNHNNFRLNQDPGATNLPDLTVENVSSSTFLCADGVELFFEIRNRGWAAADKGIPVVISIIDEDDAITEVARLTTTRYILPGEAVPMAFSYVKENAKIDALSFLVTVGDQDIALECNAENNSKGYDYTCRAPIN